MDAILSSTLAFFSLLLFTKLLLYLSSKKLKLPPSGPQPLPLLGHLYLFKKPLHRTLANLAAGHGSILLLQFGSRRVLVVSSASLAEECFSKNDIAFANRPQLPSEKHLSYNYTNLGDTNYGPHWRNLRRIATIELLSAHRLHSFTTMRTDEVCSMIAKLVYEAEEDDGGFKFTKVDLRPRMFGLTLNIMMRMITGRRHFKDSKEAREFEEIVEESLSLSGASNVADFLPVLGLFDFHGVERRVMRLQLWRDQFLQGLIDKHRIEEDRSKSGEDGDREEKKKTLIGVLLSLQDSDPKYYTDRVIKSLMAVSFQTSLSLSLSLSLSE